MTTAPAGASLDAPALRRRVAALVETHDPATTDQREFLAARFDAGLAWLKRLGVPVTVHLGVGAVLIAAIVPLAVRGFLPDAHDPEHADQQHGGSRRRALSAWREPRTLLVGIFVLCFAFAEGTGNDWTSIALIDGYHTSAAVGTLGFAALNVFAATLVVGVLWAAEVARRDRARSQRTPAS